MLWERRFVTCPPSDNLAKHNVFFYSTFAPQLGDKKHHLVRENLMLKPKSCVVVG